MDVEFAAAVMDGHVAALAMVLAIGKQLVHEFVQSKSTVFENPCFTVLREDHV